LPSRASAISSPHPSQTTTGRTLSGDISIFNGMRNLQSEHPFASGAIVPDMMPTQVIGSDFDGHGRFMVDASGRLILPELWLGASRQESGPLNCGHHFVG
jgi:hypothetical protein